MVVSTLSSLKSYLVSSSQRLLERWKPEGKEEPPVSVPRPVNFIGLPVILTSAEARLFFRVLKLTPDKREQLLSDVDLVRWAESRGLGAPTQAMILDFYSDARYRRRRLDRIGSPNERKKKHLTLQIERSLELNLITTVFPEVIREKGPMDIEQWKNSLAGVLEDIELLQCVLSFCKPLTNLGKACMLILYELKRSLPQWSSLDDYERGRIIIGLFLVMSVSRSLGPLTWAVRQVPTLAGEFADVRLVYRRTQQRSRPPTQRQKLQIRRLWRRQLRALRRQLSQLGSQPPSAADLLQLRQQTKVLALIHSARKRHRRLRAQTRSS